MLAVFYASGGAPMDRVLASFVCTVVAILWHELGHAFAARFCRCTPSITLYWRGGLTHIPVAEGRAPLTWKEDIAVSIAGPVAGFVFGGLVWVMSRAWTPSSALGILVVQRLLWVNLGWGALNLLPLQPWDGGLAARTLLIRVSPRRGETIADVVTLALGASLAIAAVAYGWYWAAYLAGIGPVQSVANLRRRRQRCSLSEAWAAWDDGRLDEARAMSAAIVDHAADDTLRAEALEIVILVALRRCDGQAVQAARDAYPSTVTPSSLLAAMIAWDASDLDAAAKNFRDVSPALLQRAYVPIIEAWLKTEWRAQLEKAFEPDAVAKLPRFVLALIATCAFYAKDFALTRRVSEELFAVHRAPDDAYNLACTLAQLGDVEAALGWLEKAIDAGYTDVEHLESNTDLTPLRGAERWATALARARAPDVVRS